MDPTTYDFDANPNLVKRIVGSPHGYFRFINVAFAQEVCRRFEEHLGESPRVNLHGDAHLEQYAITDLGRGLTDFDDSTAGPAVLDLVRFGVSLTLAARALKVDLPTQTKLQKRFLEGYRRGLDQPDGVPQAPELVAKMQEGFNYDRAKYLKWVGSVMQPVSAERREAFDSAWGSYVAMARRGDTKLSGAFFEVIQLGALSMGIGSALDEKYIVRVAGPSKDPLDDIILEVKEVRDLSGIDCVTGNGPADPFRILVGQSRIAYTPYGYLGYLRMNGKVFWVHSWVDNYQELSIKDMSAVTPAQRGEVVYDASVQLGRGHTHQIAAPLGPQLRQAQLTLMKRHESTIQGLIVQMVTETETAWMQFKAAAGTRQKTGT